MFFSKTNLLRISDSVITMVMWLEPISPHFQNFWMAYYLHAKFHWNRNCDLEKKSVGKGPFLSPILGSKKRLKTPGQIELNMNFTHSEMSIICFSREQLPSLIGVGCIFYNHEDSTSYQPFLVVRNLSSV